MVKIINCDIFKAPIDVLIQGCNCFNTMGGGIALVIKNLFPEAYQADSETKKGDRAKLGKYSLAMVKRSDSQIKYIFNLYQQYEFGGDRALNYEAFYSGLELIRGSITNTDLVIGIPYGIGCGLANGSWPIVYEMIKEIFKDSTIDVLICKKD